LQIQACIAHAVTTSRKHISGSAAVMAAGEDGMHAVFQAAATAVRVRACFYPHCSCLTTQLLLLSLLYL
jgi:hypothetical protein